MALAGWREDMTVESQEAGLGKELQGVEIWMLFRDWSLQSDGLLRHHCRYCKKQRCRRIRWHLKILSLSITDLLLPIQVVDLQTFGAAELLHHGNGHVQITDRHRLLIQTPVLGVSPGRHQQTAKELTAQSHWYNRGRCQRLRRAFDQESIF